MSERLIGDFTARTWWDDEAKCGRLEVVGNRSGRTESTPIPCTNNLHWIFALQRCLMALKAFVKPEDAPTLDPNTNDMPPLPQPPKTDE